MQLPQNAPQFLRTEALVIVAAREEGVIYRIKDGIMQQVDVVEQHLLPLSDDEGFFFGGAGGGAPKDRDNEEAEYNKRLRRKIAHELDQLIKKENARVLYIFEPEHLKGRIAAELQEHKRLSVHTVAYGNYMHETPRKLIDHITEYIQEHKIDLDDNNYEQDLQKY